MSVSSLPSVPLRLSSSSLDATEPGFIITQTVINMGPVDLSSDVGGGGFQDKQQQAFMIYFGSKQASKQGQGLSRVHQGSYKGDLKRANQWIGTIACETARGFSRRPYIYTTRYSFFFLSSCPGVTPQDSSSPSGGERSSEKVFEMLEPISHVIYVHKLPGTQSQGANVHVGIWKVHRREDFSFLPIRIYKIALTYRGNVPWPVY